MFCYLAHKANSRRVPSSTWRGTTSILSFTWTSLKNVCSHFKPTGCRRTETKRFNFVLCVKLVADFEVAFQSNQKSNMLYTRTEPTHFLPWGTDCTVWGANKLLNYSYNRTANLKVWIFIQHVKEQFESQSRI